VSVTVRYAIAGSAAAVVLAVALLLRQPRQADIEGQSPVGSTHHAAATIESSGRILGVAIGDTMESARATLDPLRARNAYPPDEKEQSGRRIYWKLENTDYEWIMAWALPGGRINRIRAVLRPDKLKRFDEIGDLRRALTVDDTTVRWNLRQENGSMYRLVAQGLQQRANTVYMFSMDAPPEEPRADEKDVNGEQ